ncbi:hypothetical protein [Thalassospira sp. TSL5-1]|uniref:hypothetical protein n=1 Tax=Thalassospira sp. TSL5-1 TaxID=1544451 RepID=UPI00143C772F|nr:hypothetical protein [Thalassospira sp. TSL5-1]
MTTWPLRSKGRFACLPMVAAEQWFLKTVIGDQTANGGFVLPACLRAYIPS